MQTLSIFQKHSKSLLDTGLFSDMVIICEDSAIKVHKSQLALIFDAEQLNRGSIKISGVSKDQLRKFLNFLYTGTVFIDDYWLIKQFLEAFDSWEYFKDHLKQMFPFTDESVFQFKSQKLYILAEFAQEDFKEEDIEPAAIIEHHLEDSNPYENIIGLGAQESENDEVAKIEENKDKELDDNGNECREIKLESEEVEKSEMILKVQQPPEVKEPKQYDFVPQVKRGGPKGHNTKPDMPYKCEICGSGHRYRLYLQNHMRRNHSGKQREQMCDKCEKSFYEKKELQSHIEVVHLNIKKFQCELCGQKSSSNGNRRKHMWKKHQKKI